MLDKVGFDGRSGSEMMYLALPAMAQMLWQLKVVRLTIVIKASKSYPETGPFVRETIVKEEKTDEYRNASASLRDSITIPR